MDERDPTETLSVTVESMPGALAFAERAGDFLLAHEAEDNLVIALCDALRRNPSAFGIAPPVFAIATLGRSVVAAVLRTPPRDAILSHVADERAIEPLARHLVSVDPGVPGVNGDARWARPFATAIGDLTRRTPELVVEERIHRLTRVIAPPAAPGSVRLVTARDRELLARWLHDFVVEALPHEPAADGALLAARWLDGDRRMYAWEDAGEMVSIAGIGGHTPNGFRIGPVYTPPDRRGRGYASNVVAAATQRELDAGRRFAFLYTDRSNPTSNAIYAAIGYEPVTDVEVIALRGSGDSEPQP